jgi:hypothetical protein
VKPSHKWRCRGQWPDGTYGKWKSLDGINDCEFFWCIICSGMIAAKSWDRAIILPPGCNSLDDASAIRVTRGKNGLPIFTGPMTSVGF